MKRLAGALLGLAIAAPWWAAAAAAQEAPPAAGEPKDFSLPEGTEYALDNGLSVTLVPYGKVPKVTVRLLIRTGNIDEAADEVWLADLTGDLMKEGTATRTAEQIASEAASMGGSLNVGVGVDQTTIGGEVLSEFGPDLVALIADVALNPAFPESELDRLKADRIRQVSIARTQPQATTMEQFRKVMYPAHPYGRVFPTEEMIGGYTADQIRAFHAENFNASRAHVYVTGRFGESAMRSSIQASLGDWAPGSLPTVDVPEPVAGRAVHVLSRPGAAQSTIYLGLPVVDPSHEDWVPLQVTNSLLGGAFISRITTNIREDKGYTYSPNSSLSSRYRDAYWVETADVTTAVTGASLDEIFSEIEMLRNQPPPEDELRRIQNYMGGIFVLQNSSRSGIINQLAFLDLHGLPDDYLTGYVNRVYSVTPPEVQRIMQEYIRPDDLLLVVTGDTEQIEDQIGEYGTPIFVEQAE
jgi:predicted Zn-dependent peptidase